MGYQPTEPGPGHRLNDYGSIVAEDPTPLVCGGVPEGALWKTGGARHEGFGPGLQLCGGSRATLAFHSSSTLGGAKRPQVIGFHTSRRLPARNPSDTPDCEIVENTTCKLQSRWSMIVTQERPFVRSHADQRFPDLSASSWITRVDGKVSSGVLLRLGRLDEFAGQRPGSTR